MSCSSGDCCARCHFSWEEKHVLPHLPVHERRKMRQAHRRLARAGYPPAEVHAHAVEEMRAFRRYAPPHIVESVARQHVKLDM